MPTLFGVVAPTVNPSSGSIFARIDDGPDVVGNVILGSRAGKFIDESGSKRNVFLGPRAGEKAYDNTVENVFIGFQAGGTTRGSRNVGIGFSCLGGAEAANWGGINPLTAWDGISTPAPPAVQVNNVAIGNECILVGTVCVGNVALGDHALTGVTSGSHNVAIGDGSPLGDNVTGNYNVSLGFGSGSYARGSSNVFIGQGAGAGTNANKNTASSNIFIGQSAGAVNTSGAMNTIVGTASFTVATTASNNTALGRGSLAAVTTGGNNTGVGSGTLNAVAGGASNTGIGWRAGQKIVSTTNGVFLGADAGNTDGTTASTDQAQMTLIGYRAQGTRAQVFVMGSALTGERSSLFAGLVGSAANAGSGVGTLLAMADVTTVPTTNVTGGGLMYFESGVFKVRSSAGDIFSTAKQSAITSPTTSTSDLKTAVDAIRAVLSAAGLTA